jgi:hypothetical protein
MTPVKGNMNVRTKIMINNHITGQVSGCNYLGHTVTVTNNRDLKIKMNRFNRICPTISRTLNYKTRKNTKITFYKAMAVSTYTYIWVRNLNCKKIKTWNKYEIVSLHK